MNCIIRGECFKHDSSCSFTRAACGMGQHDECNQREQTNKNDDCATRIMQCETERERERVQLIDHAAVRECVRVCVWLRVCALG